MGVWGCGGVGGGWGRGVGGLGFGVRGSGFGVWGLGSGGWNWGFGVWGLGFGVWGLGLRVQGLGLGFQGLGCRFQGVWPRVLGLEFKVWVQVYLWTPSTFFSLLEPLCRRGAGPGLRKGGKLYLLISKHDHFTPAREIKRHERALARNHPAGWKMQGQISPTTTRGGQVIQSALNATQGHMDGFFSQFPFKCYLGR